MSKSFNDMFCLMGMVYSSSGNSLSDIPEGGICFTNKATGGGVAPVDYPNIDINEGGHDVDVLAIFGVSDQHPSTTGTFVGCPLGGGCDWAGSFH